VYRQACNFVDTRQRVITLAAPPVGNGPFSIIVDAPAGLFGALRPGQPVRANDAMLAVGSHQIELSRANIWDPHLPVPESLPRVSPAIATILAAHTHWPPPNGNGLMAEKIAQLANKARAQLNRAILQNSGQLETAAGQLAGLGGGLTPAGDDYLVGVMALLWLAGRAEESKRIAAAAAPKTTALSAAFLTAAGAGQFVEPWHGLAQALVAANTPAITQATGQITEFGATSGRDALAGFATTLLNLAQ